MTQAPIFVWFDGTIIVALYYYCPIMYYYSVYVLLCLVGSARQVYSITVGFSSTLYC